MAKKIDYNSDWMSRKQDEQLEQLEERLTALYANAENEIRAKYTDFMAGFEKDDKAKRELVEQGQISEDEYTAWRKNTMLKSTEYTKAVESMTNVLVNTDAAAMATVNDDLPQVVAESYDFVQALGYETAKGSGLTAGTFQIYNAETVQALIKDNPDMMPKPSVDIPEDKRWNKDRINRELTQGIVQGESIPKIATRLQGVTTMDRNAAIRNARTAMTGAENMGRYQSAQDLRENGIPVEEVWSATHDSRTRETHMEMDGTTRDASGYFGVGIIATPLRFAGDPAGDPEEVYNCRCRTSIVLKGIDHSKDGDLYAEFMKQFEEGEKVLEGEEPAAESQHQEPEQKTIEEIQPEIAPIEYEKTDGIWGEGVYLNTTEGVDTSDYLTVELGKKDLKDDRTMYIAASYTLPEDQREEYRQGFIEKVQSGTEITQAQKESMHEILEKNYSGTIIKDHFNQETTVVVYDTSTIGEVKEKEPAPAEIEQPIQEPTPAEQLPQPEETEKEGRGHIEERYVDDLDRITPEGARKLAEDLDVTEKTAKKYAESITKYTGSDYTYVRMASRGDEKGLKEYNSSKDIKEYKKTADNLEKFIEKSPEWNGGPLYRGITLRDGDAIEAMKEKAQNGEPIDMLGVSSWTSNVDIAGNFSESYSKNTTGFVFVSTTDSIDCGTSIRHLSTYQDEDEVLVSKMAEFKPKEIKEENGIFYIYGEMERRKK